MKRTMWHLIVLVALVALSAGCAKKATEAPPTPATPPPAKTETPPTPPPPAPEQPPTPSTTVRSEDFQPAYFDLDSYTLRDDARSALDHNAKLLRDNANTKITIEGHCDERGTVEYNQSLGEKRAQAARDYLAAAAIDGSRMEIISYGKERPFDPGHDEGAWSKNRRAHFVVR